MGILETLNNIRANYPGGWRRYARGYEGYKSPPFVQQTSPDDRRSLIPPMGYREYWYPALPDKDVSWKKPVGLKIMGEDLVFFRDKNGQVQALWDYCPHRGVYLSLGDCFWKGYLSCPYHGATYDGNGECVEFITEGPDSKMVGRLQAKKYPTRTLKGLVFVWMGEGEPVPIEEDVPPEFFEENAVVKHTFRYWHCNWMIALENTYDAHNCFWVHRDSINCLRGEWGGRPRMPIGFRAKLVNNKAVNKVGGNEQYYADENGKIPYQMYYPRVGAYWPLHRYRLLWTWLTEKSEPRKQRRSNGGRFATPAEWEGTRLPGMQRLPLKACMHTRWCVPVDENLTRVINFDTYRPKSTLERIYKRMFSPIHEFIYVYDFSNQDHDAARTTRYQYPEYLSSTDSYVVGVRKLFAEYGRGVQKRIEMPEETAREALVSEADKLLGVRPMVGVFANGIDEKEIV